MIPKIIHYCWFGGNPLNELAQKCIDSWKKYCPDYEIIEWNETNFDIAGCPLYVRQAYEQKMWAFVSDYVRLKIVYDNGGVYLDTDVELLKNVDSLLTYTAYFGFENAQSINTGLGFGAGKSTEILYDLMCDYDNIPFVLPDGYFDKTPCPVRNTKVFMKYGLVLNNQRQILKNKYLILPAEYLCPKDYETGDINQTVNTISIHHFNQSWHNSFDKYLYKKKLFFLKKYGNKVGYIEFEQWKKKKKIYLYIKKYGICKLLTTLISKI